MDVSGQNLGQVFAKGFFRGANFETHPHGVLGNLEHFWKMHDIAKIYNIYQYIYI